MNIHSYYQLVQHAGHTIVCKQEQGVTGEFAYLWCETCEESLIAFLRLAPDEERQIMDEDNETWEAMCDALKGAVDVCTQVVDAEGGFENIDLEKCSPLARQATEVHSNCSQALDAISGW